jgi:hypothetical protein
LKFEISNLRSGESAQKYNPGTRKFVHPVCRFEL